MDNWISPMNVDERKKCRLNAGEVLRDGEGIGFNINMMDRSPVAGSHYLIDEKGQTNRLIDRNTGRGFVPDRAFVAAVADKAQRSGVPIETYLADRLRFQIA
jgi:hypothetical protein